MSDGLRTLLVLLMLVGGTIAVTFIVYVVAFIINRKRKSDIKELQIAYANMKVLRDQALIKSAALTAENITLRGINKGLNAENEALECENRELMKGAPVVRMRGTRITIK